MTLQQLYDAHPNDVTAAIYLIALAVILFAGWIAFRQLGLATVFVPDDAALRDERLRSIDWPGTLDHVERVSEEESRHVHNAMKRVYETPARAVGTARRSLEIEVR